MGRRPRRTLTLEQKQDAVRRHLSGENTVHELAQELEVATGQIYKWKAQLEEHSEKQRVSQLTDAGWSESAARALREKELEIEAYQKKIAELTVINDLLKNSQPRGIINPRAN
jgi:transposase-like protein